MGSEMCIRDRADSVGASSDDDKTDSQDVSRDEEDNTVRQLTSEELALFQGFIQTKKGKTELAKSLDNISLASYTGNVCVIGDSAEEALSLAKNVIQYAKTTDSNFAGKVGKVSGESLNGKDVAATVERMQNGGLIVCLLLTSQSKRELTTTRMPSSAVKKM